MELVVRRLGDRLYNTILTRADGVKYRVKGVGHMADFPHDLQHLAIEGSLGLEYGFWGTIALGGVFGSMEHLEGRRRPHASRRSREILRANKADISEAEMLVSIFAAAFSGPSTGAIRRARARLEAHGWTRPGKGRRDLGDTDLERAYETWWDLHERWHALPVGEALHFHWLTYLRSRGSRSTGS